MNPDLFQIDLGDVTVLEFKGLDAVRFLNGQMTQDVRLLVGKEISLPSCVTDAKGRLQFRVWVTAVVEDAVWVSGLAEWREDLEMRLKRYLIADEVEVIDRSAEYRLVHFTGGVGDAPGGVVARESKRYGFSGVDWFVPKGGAGVTEGRGQLLEGDGLEAMRIRQRIGQWGREWVAGMLPPEGRLEDTDVSYHKGCYIGQEVISRMKSAGKVNRLFSSFAVAAGAEVDVGVLVDGDGKPAGELTSVSPETEGGVRLALGYVKRGASEFFAKEAGGDLVVVERC